jgi:hypothetical protein
MDNSRQDWNIPNKIVDPYVYLCFTDGSEANDYFGAGIYGPRHCHGESSLSTVFSVEVMAILKCAELLLVKNMTMTRTPVCSNSRTASAALAKTTTASALVWEC